jgi:hypothetical protein
MTPNVDAVPDAGKPPAPCPPLDEQIEKLSQSAAQGEFDKGARDKLVEIQKAADAALMKYKDAANGWQALTITWDKQQDAVKNIRRHLESCYPNWREDLKAQVCEKVIRPLQDMRTKRREALGKDKLQVRQEDAAHCFAEAVLQLDAWKDISGTLKKRLDDNQALIDEICKLDKCEDHAFALYIFYFELLRQHGRLRPDKTPKEDRYDPVVGICDMEIELRKKACGLVGLPWLIHPDQYMKQLGLAACRWRDAGKRKADADAEAAWIEELRKRFIEDSKPANRRAKAKQNLKNLQPGKKDGDAGGAGDAGGGGAGGGPGGAGGGYPAPQPEPEPYGGKPEPYPQPEPVPYGEKPEPYPRPEPEPNGEKPEPYPRPQPEPYGGKPEPYPAPEPEPYGGKPEPCKEPEPDPYPEPKPEPYGGDKPEPYPEPKPMPQPYGGGKPEPYPEPKPEPKPEPEPKPQPYGGDKPVPEPRPYGRGEPPPQPRTPPEQPPASGGGPAEAEPEPDPDPEPPRPPEQTRR